MITIYYDENHNIIILRQPYSKEMAQLEEHAGEDRVEELGQDNSVTE